MQLQRLLILLLATCSLLAAPRSVAAQAGGFPVQTTASTRFVFADGEVVRRDGARITALAQNVKLANGTKINIKNGIVEMPADKINPQGKKITLREGDYVRADGGVVFATPASAAAAAGAAPIAPAAKYETYVQRGPGYAGSAGQAALLSKKVALLNQKVALLAQACPNAPDTRALDEQLAKLDAQLAQPK